MLSSGVGAAILGNWQTNIIAQFRIGPAYTVAVVGDVANIGNEIAGRNYARPNLIGNPRLDNPTTSAGLTHGVRHPGTVLRQFRAECPPE